MSRIIIRHPVAQRKSLIRVFILAFDGRENRSRAVRPVLECLRVRQFLLGQQPFCGPAERFIALPEQIDRIVKC